MPKNPERITFHSIFQPNVPQVVSGSVSNFNEWNDFYSDAIEALPGMYIEPLGDPVSI